MRTGLVFCLLLLLPSPAYSSVPTHPAVPGTCSRVPVSLVLVGTDGASPDASVGAFEVVVCRWMNPALGADVAITPSSAAAGVRLGSQAEPSPAYSNCPEGIQRFVTDANGVCRVTLTGSVDVGLLSPSSEPAVSVYANGVWFGDIPVVCYDLDGAGGVGAADLSVWLALFGSGEDHRVADYNGSGAIDADDLSHWLEVFGSGGQAVTASPLCP